MREQVRYLTTTKGNLTCIKNADYGRDGEICCCNGYDYCNEFGVNAVVSQNYSICIVFISFLFTLCNFY